MLKVKVIGNENMKTKTVLCSYPREKWIELRQTKTKMIIWISCQFCVYRRNASFCDICL